MSYTKAYSPSQADSDQKDIIIRQLKDDIIDLKKTQENYYELNQSLIHLENKYSTLEDARKKSQMIFRTKHEQDHRTISNLKKNIENLASTQRKKQVSILEFKSENETLEKNSTEKWTKLNELQAQLQKATETNQQLLAEKSKFTQNISLIKEQLKDMGISMQMTQKDNDQSVLIQTQCEKDLSQLGFSKSVLEKQLAFIENENASLKLEIKTKLSQVNFFQKQKKEGEVTFEQLEKELLQLEELFNKLKSEANDYNTQKEQFQQKGNDLAIQLIDLNSSIKQKGSQIDGTRTDNGKLRNEILEFININQQLSYDLEVLKRHAELIIERNQQFLNEFEFYGQQDEQISIQLNRKQRIEQLRIKEQEKIKSALQLITNPSGKKK